MAGRKAFTLLINTRKLFTILLCSVLLLSCKSTDSLEENEYKKIKEISLFCADKSFETSSLQPYLNKKQPANIQRDLVSILNNMGYMQVRVDVDSSFTKKNELNLKFIVTPGKQLIVDKFQMNVEDEDMDGFLRENGAYPRKSEIEGKPFNANKLNQERNRLTNFLLDNGYARFNKDFISVDADTLTDGNTVSLTMNIEKFRANSRMEATNHPVFNIGKINYTSLNSSFEESERNILRDAVLKYNTMFEPGKRFRYQDLQNTYNRFGRFTALRSTQVQLKEQSDSIIDVDIRLTPAYVNSISFQPEGTNTAGDLGAAASLTYMNKNIFRGSETFSLQLRGAFEAIRGLEGYSNNDFIEFGAEAKIEFPRLLAPFVASNFRRRQLATSELSVSYNMQDRPEFHRRVFRGIWRYRWQSSKKTHSYVFDLLDLNYISMPWISPTFKENYLESGTKRNAILKYNYEDLFIMKTGVSMSYKGKSEAYRIALETAGNLLNCISELTSPKKNEDGQNIMFNIAYAQFVKFDFDYTKLIPLSQRTQLVFHTDLGVACPYGNSNILPFEKRYFTGGANSVRGWSVRSLGPGRFRSTDGAIDFINQTGDLKLDFNVELRGPLFWKLNYAVFADAGNIWTLRAYKDQPGGQFKFNTFAEELAVAYGAGIRFNFDYFILRFDCGMKAINPAYENSREHYAIFHPNMKRNFTFHFAVGMPF